MPRLFHTPPKYRRHKSTNQAIVHFGGRRVYLGPYGSEKSHRRYQQLLAEWREQRHDQPESRGPRSVDEELLDGVNAGTLRDKRKQGLKVSINELILVYVRHARSYYQKRGQVTREAEMIEEIATLVGSGHGRRPIDEFGPVDLDEFRDWLIDERDWSRKHINKQIVRIVAMFKWAAKKELCSPTVPMALMQLGGLKKGRTKARETAGVTCVEDAVVDQTLPALPEIVADMVRFQRLTGARPGEVCALRPGDLDRSEEVWLYRPDAHKTEHHEQDRTIAIGPRAQEVLLPYLVRGSKTWCFSPAESIERSRRRAEASRKTPQSCGNTRGSNRVAAPKRLPSDKYSVSSYRMAIRRGCNKLGLPVWSPNQLRHTAATEIRKQFGLEAAQVICGHQTADVTQVYAERNLDLARQVAKAVG